MRQHRPKPVQRGRGHLDAQHRNVPLQERLDEILPPLEAQRLARRQKRIGESSAHPQVRLPLDLCLGQGETAHVHEMHPARQRLRGLLHQIGRRAPQQKKATRKRFPIRQHPQERQQVSPLLNLIQHHQPTRRFQHSLRMRQTRQVSWTLQIVIAPGLPLAQHLGQRRLATLTRPQN